MAMSHVRAPTKWQTDHALIRVADLLDIPVVHAYGLVTALTAYCMEQHQSGDVRSLSTLEIERAVEWTGERGAFASVILDNYVDGRGVLLRWSETAEPILKERAANLNRVNRFRQKMRETQDAKVDDFVRQRTGGNGGRPLPSRQESASPPVSPSASPSPASPAAPDATRARAPKPDAAAPAPPRKNGPPTPASKKAAPPPPKFDPPVMGDNGRYLPSADGSFARYMIAHQPNSPLTEFVMRDSMGDVTGDETRDATRDVTLSRAVVQDLEPEKGSTEEQRSQPQASVGTATIPVERARVIDKMSILTSTILGLPVEEVAALDDMVGMYGDVVLKAWSSVSMFIMRFYPEASDDTVVGILNEMILVQSPDGIVSPSGARVAQVSGRALTTALEQTVRRPPNRFASAWPYTLRMLENGRGNLEVGSDGFTATERASAANHRQDARIAPEVRRVMDGMTGPWRRKSVTSEADQKRTAVRWMLSNDPLKLELAELCEKVFAGWNQSLPGLETAKDNWVKQEALKRWRAAGRPLPLPPR